MDDDWMICPFNSAHVVLRKRLAYHIIKCRSNYKGPPLEICPYNATHYVPKGKSPTNEFGRILRLLLLLPGTLPKHFEDCLSFFHAVKEKDYIVK